MHKHLNGQAEPAPLWHAEHDVKDDEKNLTLSAFLTKRQMASLLEGVEDTHSPQSYYDSAYWLLEKIHHENDAPAMAAALEVVNSQPEAVACYLFDYTAGFEGDKNHSRSKRQERFFDRLERDKSEVVSLLMKSAYAYPAFQGYKNAHLLVVNRREDVFEALKGEAITRFCIERRVAAEIIRYGSIDLVSKLFKNKGFTDELVKAINDKDRTATNSETSPIVYALFRLALHSDPDTLGVIRLAAETGLFKNGYISQGGGLYNTILDEEGANARFIFETMVAPHVDVDPKVIYTRLLLEEMKHIASNGKLSKPYTLEEQFMPELRKRMDAFPDGLDKSVADHICEHLINNYDSVLSAFQSEILLSEDGVNRSRKLVRI